MAPSQSKIAAADLLDVKCSMDHQAANYIKSAKRFKQIITDFKERDDAIPIPAWKVLPSPFNRLGAPLNMQYAHCELGPNIHNKGFDPSRPKPGLVVNRTDPEKIKRLKAHAANMRGAAHGLYPPIQIASAECHYECVGGNHITVVIQFYESEYTSPITNLTFKVPKDDPELKDKVKTGHAYIVLRDDVPDEDLAFVSEYLNSDQNENQCTSEMSTLSQVNDEYQKELKNTPHPKVSKIVQMVSSSSLVKLRPDSIGDMAHYASNQSGTGYVQELVEWHSRIVNPKELSVSARWMGDTAKTLGKLYPIMMMGFTFIQYRGDLKFVQTRPLPDLSRTIGLPQLNVLMKDPTNLDVSETYCRDNRKALDAEFQDRLGKSRARSMFHVFEEAASRLLLSQSLNVEFDHNVSGKFSKEKLIALRSAWITHIEEKTFELKGVIEKFNLVADGDENLKASVDEVFA